MDKFQNRGFFFFFWHWSESLELFKPERSRNKRQWKVHPTFWQISFQVLEVAKLLSSTPLHSPAWLPFCLAGVYFWIFQELWFILSCPDCLWPSVPRPWIALKPSLSSLHIDLFTPPRNARMWTATCARSDCNTSTAMLSTMPVIARASPVAPNLETPLNWYHLYKVMF